MQLSLFTIKVREASDVCYSRGWQEHENMRIGQEPASPDDYLSTIVSTKLDLRWW